jgi:3-isopropylmalate dehydrogenase
MLLRISLGIEKAATAVELAVADVLDAGFRTRDLAAGGPELSTHAITEHVMGALGRRMATTA